MMSTYVHIPMYIYIYIYITTTSYHVVVCHTAVSTLLVTTASTETLNVTILGVNSSLSQKLHPKPYRLETHITI